MRKPPSSPDRSVGARLKILRVSAGMSQRTLAEAIGVTYQQIQKYEKGANRIAATTLPELARAFGVDASYFLKTQPAGEPEQRGFGEPEPQPYLADFAATTEGVQLIRAFASIRDPKRRKHILDLVKSLAEDPDRSV